MSCCKISFRSPARLDPLTTSTDKIIFDILSFLDIKSIVKLQLLNKRMRKKFKHILWKDLIILHFHSEIRIADQGKYHSVYRELWLERNPFHAAKWQAYEARRLDYEQTNRRNRRQVTMKWLWIIFQFLVLLTMAIVSIFGIVLDTTVSFNEDCDTNQVYTYYQNMTTTGTVVQAIFYSIVLVSILLWVLIFCVLVCYKKKEIDKSVSQATECTCIPFGLMGVGLFCVLGIVDQIPDWLAFYVFKFTGCVITELSGTTLTIICGVLCFWNFVVGIELLCTT